MKSGAYLMKAHSPSTKVLFLESLKDPISATRAERVMDYLTIYYLDEIKIHQFLTNYLCIGAFSYHLGFHSGISTAQRKLL